MLLIGPKMGTCHFVHVCVCPHEDNPNIGLSDKDQELLDILKLLDFMENEKSKSPTLPRNLSWSSTNYKKPSLHILSVDIDQSQY
jgi:hypothetical protein